MKRSKKHVSCKRLCCISLAISSSCVWCFEAQQGRVATLNVCKSHKEIVSGRLGLVNSFLICQPVFILPPNGGLQHPKAFIYFLDSFFSFAYTFLPPNKQTLHPTFAMFHTHIHTLCFNIQFFRENAHSCRKNIWTLHYSEKACTKRQQ